MDCDEELKKASDVLHALGNVVRLKILLMLDETKKPLHIKAVSQNLGMDYGVVYRHVKVLKDTRLLKFYDVGRSCVLSPTNMKLIKEFIENAKTIAKQ